MKTKIYIFGLSLLCFFVYSQSITYVYYIEFTNTTNKPVITKQNKKSKTILLNNSRFEVLQYVEAFSNYTTESLKNTYLIEFKTATDFNNFIFSNRNEIVTYEKIESVDDPLLIQVGKNKKTGKNTKILNYTPDDYYLYPADIAHTYLDLINAREAWDYSKGDSIVVGISDSGFRLTHKEFENKISTLPGQTVSNYDEHGSLVAGTAGANTDNNFGDSSIGFNNKLLVTDIYGAFSWDALKQLSLNGARVINMSWYIGCSPIPQHQAAVNELYANGTVLVAAAGNNSQCGGPLMKLYPAAYDNVISVSGVGHLNDLNSGITTNVKDIHQYNYATGVNYFHHNEAVDIVAPALDLAGLPYYTCDTCLYTTTGGTSFAAPLVSGALSLLFSSNNCLSPLEAETILKLTSANIDQLPPNQQFAGLLGAGRLDAGKANKMAWQMNSTNGGEVLIEDKNFNRWDFELLNSPEFIKIQNESFTDASNVNFKAKKAITLDINTLLEPGTGKSHYLFVENTDTCSDFNPSSRSSIAKKEVITSNLYKNDISVYPNPFHDVLKISDVKNVKSISINDVSGRQVKTLAPAAEINLANLKDGLYIVNLQMQDGSVKSIKAIKK